MEPEPTAHDPEPFPKVRTRHEEAEESELGPDIRRREQWESELEEQKETAPLQTEEGAAS
jgi:hypothetical protein